MNTETFRALLNRIADRYPSRAEMAKALRITGSRLSRALNVGDFPFNTENCLRLAKLSGEPPAEILRAANKAEIADLIASLYKPAVTPAQSKILDLWDALPESEQRALEKLMRGYVRDQQAATTTGMTAHRKKKTA